MSLKARAFDPEGGIEYPSDIESLEYSDDNVKVVVACSLNDVGNVNGIEVIFSEVTGFRLLDELDLARYWLSKDFPRGCHVLEVNREGWSDEENKLQGFETKRREWLIVTGNACVNVFCESEPKMKDVTWKFEA